MDAITLPCWSLIITLTPNLLFLSKNSPVEVYLEHVIVRRSPTCVSRNTTASVWRFWRDRSYIRNLCRPCIMKNPLDWKWFITSPKCNLAMPDRPNYVGKVIQIHPCFYWILNQVPKGRKWRGYSEVPAWIVGPHQCEKRTRPECVNRVFRWAFVVIA